MSHGRIYVLSDEQLTDEMREEVFDRVQESLVPNKFDYIDWITQYERHEEEEASFYDEYPFIEHKDNVLFFSLKDCFTAEKEHSSFPIAVTDPLTNYCKYKYWFITASYTWFVMVRSAYTDIEIEDTLLDGVLMDRHWDSISTGTRPALSTRYSYVLSDIYDFHI